MWSGETGAAPLPARYPLLPGLPGIPSPTPWQGFLTLHAKSNHEGKEESQWNLALELLGASNFQHN